MREAYKEKIPEEESSNNDTLNKDIDPIRELFKKNMKFLRVKRKQLFNMHISRDYTIF